MCSRLANFRVLACVDSLRRYRLYRVEGTGAVIVSSFEAEFFEVVGRGCFNFFSPMEPAVEVIPVVDSFEVFIDVVMKLVFLGSFEDVFDFDGDEGHSHVEQIMFVLLVDVVVEDLVDHRNW